jgi:hypothetical protein
LVDGFAVTSTPVSKEKKKKKKMRTVGMLAPRIKSLPPRWPFHQFPSPLALRRAWSRLNLKTSHLSQGVTVYLPESMGVNSVGLPTAVTSPLL